METGVHRTACMRHDSLIRLLGLLTYPLYLVHMHAGEPVLVKLLRLGVSPITALIVAVLTSLGAALIVMKL